MRMIILKVIVCLIMQETAQTTDYIYINESFLFKTMLIKKKKHKGKKETSLLNMCTVQSMAR